MDTRKLCEILLECKMITPDQLRQALAVQKSTPGQPIGKVLVELGFVQEEELRHILDARGMRQELPEILVKYDFLDKEDLQIALEMSRQEQMPLGKVLMNLDFISEESLARAMAIYYDLPFASLEKAPLQVKPGVIQSSFAQKHKLVPLSISGGIITVAMVQPLAQIDQKNLEETIRLKVNPVIATESEIVLAQQRLYNLAPPVDARGKKLGEDAIPDSIVEILAADDEPDLDFDARKVTEKDSALVKLVNKIIYDAYMKKASDIHIEPYPGKRDIAVRFRIDGCCDDYQQLPYKYKFAIPSRLKIMSDLDISERRKPQDGKINFRKFGPLDLELRVATMPTVGNLEDVVIRILSSGEPMSIEELGLSPRNMELFDQAIKNPYGLILVVGPTGSGKTTTLHAGIARINTPQVKIWTAEDPVEITQPGLRQVQVNPRIGFTFANALRSFLRLDPDIIMVGEMRDQETAGIAIEASLTGHLVFSTLHTNNAPDTVTRLLEMGLDPFSFSDSLVMILAQRLARRLCQNCREIRQPTKEELEGIAREYGTEAFAAAGLHRSNPVLARPVGCSDCLNTGYRGRLGVHELLLCSGSIKGLIRKRGDSDLIRRTAIGEGMETLKQDGIRKALQGLTDLQEIRRVCLRMGG